MKARLDSLLLSIIALAMVMGPFRLKGSNAGDLVTSLDLKSAISEGIRESPLVKKAAAGTEEASWHQVESLSGFLPTLSFNLSHFFSNQYQFLNVNLGGQPVRFPAVYALSTAELALQVPVFDGFQNVNHYHAAQAQSLAAGMELNWAQFQVEQEIRLKYLKALGAVKLEEVAQHNLKTLNDHLEQIRLLKKGGVSTHYDVLRVEVQVNEAHSESLQAEDNRTLARQRLALAMGLQEDLRPLSDELPIPAPTRIEPIELRENQLNRPDIRALESRVQASHDLASAANAYWSPKLSLNGNYQFYNNKNFSLNPSELETAYNIGLFLSWNLFDGMKSIAKAKEVSYQSIQNEKQLDQLKLQVRYDFNFWKRRCLYSASLYQTRMSNVTMAQESVRLSQDGFKAGARTSTEVLDAEFDLFRARAGVVNAQLDYAEALINLELALGTRIDSDVKEH